MPNFWYCRAQLRNDREPNHAFECCIDYRYLLLMVLAIGAEAGQLSIGTNRRGHRDFP